MGTQLYPTSGTILRMDLRSSRSRTYVKYRRGVPGDSRRRVETRATTYARRSGDTCCIDKTSSAELTEAINSMFRYYSLARICYGYLRDVAVVANERDLFGSNWFRRGWTLQELIAPRFFVFLSSSWQVLGSKADFANILEQGTDIPASVLKFEASHTAFSVAQRMS